MLLRATGAEAAAILGAMAMVAEAGDGSTAADAHALAAAGRYLFGLERPAPVPVAPAALAGTLGTPALREEAACCLTVMALVDGRIDAAKIAAVGAYAAALGLHPAYVEEIAQLAAGDLQGAVAHMVRDNMESITGRPWSDDEDVMAWMLPYRARPDPALAARYRGLAALPEGSFGRRWLEHFDHNGYAVPGEPEALNPIFCVPHDSAHVISGYDTSSRGEILVSTFTAGMHPSHPMSGHILPVLVTWHLGLKINDVARFDVGQLDPAEFWHAWARGRGTKVDLFGPEWDFWQAAPQPLGRLRAACLAE